MADKHGLSMDVNQQTKEVVELPLTTNEIEDRETLKIKSIARRRDAKDSVKLRNQGRARLRKGEALSQKEIDSLFGSHEAVLE
jgi:hypothetical protein